MQQSVLLYPLSYLFLKDERGKRLVWRNGAATLSVLIILSAPFLIFGANYFGDKGFLDRFGSFSAVLTGFYIAALVGIASFSASFVNLDDEIKIGKIIRSLPDLETGKASEELLTRRQYVCAMFGYLAFVSLLLSVSAILLIVAAGPANRVVASLVEFGCVTKCYLHPMVRTLVIVFFNIVLAHMLVTTCHGLYYLIDRLYAEKPKMLRKPKRD